MRRLLVAVGLVSALASSSRTIHAASAFEKPSADEELT